jgi:ribonuclease E
LDANAPSENPGQGDQADQQRPPRERRSRDRYGRERRERSDGADRNENSPETPVFTENSVSNEAPAQQKRVQAAPEFVAPAVQPTALAATVAAPVAAAPVANSLPKVTSYDLPMQELVQVAQGSGLQWVNSDSAKIAEAQAAIAAEVKPVHVPRERPPVVVSNEGPLVLVETKRDLRDMQLPFEKPAA